MPKMKKKERLGFEEISFFVFFFLDAFEREWGRDFFLPRDDLSPHWEESSLRWPINSLYTDSLMKGGHGKMQCLE